VIATAAAVSADSLDGLRLNRALKAGILRLLSRQEHLNKINVFPVPDGDTGTNFALTMKSVSEALQRLGDAPLPEVSRVTTCFKRLASKTDLLTLNQLRQ
jgi:dihydroxyacetone kinase-like predicted kinase